MRYDDYKLAFNYVARSFSAYSFIFCIYVILAEVSFNKVHYLTGIIVLSVLMSLDGILYIYRKSVMRARGLNA